jgi:hypothetical protein
MKLQNLLLALFTLTLSTFFSACKPDAAAPWQQFMACANNNCVDKVLAVKDAYLQDPKPLFEEFIQTDERGEDHFVGWLYILRDSVLLNEAHSPTADRIAMQQALIAKSKAFENDPKYGSWAKSIIGEIEMLTIPSETNDEGITEHVSITGTYTYELPNNVGSGEIKIYPSDEGTARFAIMVVGPPPAHNQGMMEGTAPFEGNVLTITNTDFGGQCVIQMTFTDAEVVVKTLSGDSPDCGFGNNVRADGTYRLVDDINPFMAEGGDEVPKGLEGNWVSTIDPKSEVTISNGKYIDIYAGEEVSNLPFRYFNVCPEDCDPIADTPCIQVRGQDILKSDGKTLEMSLINGRGNTLSYKLKN